MPGKLVITLKHIEVKRKEDKFKSMSPWAVVMFDGQKKVTNPIENGNQEPQFNETWNFQRNSDVKITVSLYKKEFTYDALKNEKESDLLIGKGQLNILSLFKKAQKQPVDITIDLQYDFDNKLAGQAFLSIQYSAGASLQEYRNSESVKQLKNKYESCLTISNLQLSVDQFKPNSGYYIKVRNAYSSNTTSEQNGGKTMMFQGDHEIYFKGQKLVYFDVQEILKDEQFDTLLGDDLLGIGILDFEKADLSQKSQTIQIKTRGKQIGTISCQIKYEQWQQEENLEQPSVIKMSNDELKDQIKNLEKKDKFWLSPERFQLDQQLKKKKVLDRRSMLMRHRASAGVISLSNESQMFMKAEEKNLIKKPEIVISTTTVKLPKLKTNNHVEVPTEFSKQYIREIHGNGFSSIESSSSLQKSVPKFSIPEQLRFLGPKDNFPGPGRYGTSGVTNDTYLPKRFQKVTAISEVRRTKQERKPIVQIDTGLKKNKEPQLQQSSLPQQNNLAQPQKQIK